MTRKFWILTCLTLVVSLYAPGALAQTAAPTATPKVGMQGDTLKTTFVLMENDFSKMTDEKLQSAFTYMKQVSAYYNEPNFSEFYEKYTYVEEFYSAWTDLLENQEYGSAYDSLGKLISRAWPGENAETVKNQVDVLRKYASAMDQIERSKTVALRFLESIDTKMVASPVIKNSILTNIKVCADEIKKLALEHYDKRNDKKSLELFKALVAGGHFSDTESYIAELEERLSETPEAVPEIVLSGLECVEFSPFSLTLQWNDTVDTNTYVVTYAPEGISSYSTLTVEDQTSAVLDALIPETHYAISISVKDSPVEELTGSFKTLTPEVFSQYAAWNQLVTLYKYDTKKESDYGLLFVVENALTTKMDKGVIPLPRSEISRSDTGYVIVASFFCDQTENDKVFGFRGVMRVNGGGTYQEISTASVNGSNILVNLYFPINGMLDNFYRDSGYKWQESSVVIDVYIQDRYFGFYDLELDP